MKMCLIHSEISETMEADRRSWPGKPQMDDKLVHRTAVETELADIIIRAFDYAGKYHMDLEKDLGSAATGVMNGFNSYSFCKHLNDMHDAVNDVILLPMSLRANPLQELILRVLAISQNYGYDVPGAFREKIGYNAIRPDHKTENRTAAKAGKRY